MVRHNVRPGVERYSRGAILFHWTIAVAILVNLTLGIWSDTLPRGWSVMPVHKALGITILALSVARLLWRLTHPAPRLDPTIPTWERAAAHASHWALYALTILVPLTGWAMVSGTATRRPLEWFGLFPLPYLPVPSSVGGLAHDGHILLGYALAALAAVHILAALRHHFILHDGTLARMLPVLRTSQRH